MSVMLRRVDAAVQRSDKAYSGKGTVLNHVFPSSVRKDRREEERQFLRVNSYSLMVLA